MNRKFTLLIVVVAVALVALAISQRDAAPVDLAKGTATATPGPIFAFGESELQEVTVAGPGGQSYTLARVAGGWEVDGTQASDTVSGTVRNVATLSAAQRLTDRKPEDYGFASPTLTVTLKTAAGAETTFQVGDETPVETGSRYLRLVPDDGVILVVSSFDLQQLIDWLDSPPLAPTATPEAMATGEAATEGTAEDLGSAAAETAEATAEGLPGVDETPDAAATAAGAEGPIETPAAAATAAGGEGPLETPEAGPTPTLTPSPLPTS